jgi:hypothetical protein
MPSLFYSQDSRNNFIRDLLGQEPNNIANEFSPWTLIPTEILSKPYRNVVRVHFFETVEPIMAYFSKTNRRTRIYNFF